MLCVVPYESAGRYTELPPRCFSRTITRRSTFGTTTRDTNTMTLLHPHPIRVPAPLLHAPTNFPSTRRSPQELSLVRRWLAVLCVPSMSICITCASPMVRRDGSSLEKGAMLICRDMCICRRYLQK